MFCSTDASTIRQFAINGERQNLPTTPLNTFTQSMSLISTVGVTPDDYRYRKQKLVSSDSVIFDEIEGYKGKLPRIVKFEDSKICRLIRKMSDHDEHKASVNPEHYGIWHTNTFKGISPTKFPTYFMARGRDRTGEYTSKLLEQEEVMAMLTLKATVTKEVLLLAASSMQKNTRIVHTLPSLNILHPGWQAAVVDSYEWFNLNGANFTAPTNPNVVLQEMAKGIHKYLPMMDGVEAFLDFGNDCIQHIENSLKFQYPREAQFLMEWNEAYAESLFQRRCDRDTSLTDIHGALLYGDELEHLISKEQLRYYDEYLNKFQVSIAKERAYLQKDPKARESINLIVDRAMKAAVLEYGLNQPENEQYSGHEPSAHVRCMAEFFAEKTRELIGKQVSLRHGFHTTYDSSSTRFTFYPLMFMVGEEKPLFTNSIRKNIIEFEKDQHLVSHGSDCECDLESQQHDAELNAPEAAYVFDPNEVTQDCTSGWGEKWKPEKSVFLRRNLYSHLGDAMLSYKKLIESRYNEIGYILDSVLIERTPDVKIEIRNKAKARDLEFGHPDRPFIWEHWVQDSVKRNMLATEAQLTNFFKYNMDWIETFTYVSANGGVKECVDCERAYLQAIYFTANPVLPMNNAEMMKDLALLALIRANIVLAERKDSRRLLSQEMGHKLRYTPQELLSAGRLLLIQSTQNISKHQASIAQLLQNRTELVKRIQMALELSTDCAIELTEYENIWVLDNKAVLGPLSKRPDTGTLIAMLLNTEQSILKSWRMAMNQQCRVYLLSLAINMCNICMSKIPERLMEEVQLKTDTLCSLFAV